MTLLTYCFYSLESYFLVLECRQTHFLCFFFLKWKDEKKLNFWTKTVEDHGLTVLKKCYLLDFFNSLFFQSRKAFLLSRILPYTFSLGILRKLKGWKHFNFSGLTSLEKGKCLDCFVRKIFYSSFFGLLWPWSNVLWCPRLKRRFCRGEIYWSFTVAKIGLFQRI